MEPVLGMQPFEVNDFSGGITDNVVQGAPTRSQDLDNLLIRNDKKLVERPGYRIGLGLSERGDYQLPSGLQRVNTLFSVQEETYLFGTSGQNLYWYDPINSWTSVVGPASNPAIQGGDGFNQTTVSEFQHQFYLASDGGNVSQYGVQPSKIFKNTSNVWTCLTAGLPRLYSPASFTNGSLLSACISLANALRLAFIAHMSDSIPGNSYNSGAYVIPYNFTNLHTITDKFSLSYLQSETFLSTDPETPSVIPTPAPAATDQASLFTLVGALNNAFSHHVADPAGGKGVAAGFGFYHYRFDFACPSNSPYYRSFNTPKGPHVTPSNPGAPAVAPTDLDNSNALLTCAAMLNDLYVKYNWHRLAVNTHSPTNDPAQFDKYACSVNQIGLQGSIAYVTLNNATPIITPDYTDYINYVNNLKFTYNAHVNSVALTACGPGVGSHKQADIATYPIGASTQAGMVLTSNLCKIYDATDLNSAYLIIFWLRVLYGAMHINDANSNFFIRTSMSTSNASPSVTAVVRTDTGSALTLPGVFGQNLWIPGTVAPTGVTFSGVLAAFPTAEGSGTATFNRSINATGGTTVVIGQYSDSLYHASVNWTPNSSGLQAVGDVNTSSVAQESAASFLASSVTSVGTDAASWLVLANEFLNCFNNHLVGTNNNSAQSHLWGSSITMSQLLTSARPAFFVPTVSSAVYAFIWTHQYTVENNGIIYQTQSNPTFSNQLDIAVSYPLGYPIVSPLPSSFPGVTANVTRGNTLSNLPTLINDNSTNYDTTNVILNIYRTTNAGTTWYLVSQVTNGTSSYVDTVSDSLSVGGSNPLITKQQLYTTGGVIGYDQPPICKFTHILNGITYYGAITDTGQYFPQRIRQSVPFAPDGAPATFFLDLADNLTGLSSTRGNLIAFCQNSVARVSGSFNTLGQGAMAYEIISDGIGCVNAKSIVRTEVGLFFAGTDGFYYTDGFQLIKISLELDSTYKNLVATPAQALSIYGCYDKVFRTIWWSVRSTPNAPDNDQTYIFYLNYGIKPSGVFTKALNPGAALVNHWLPSSMIFWQGNNIRGDARGYVFQAQNGLKTDPKVDTTVSATNWNTVYIPYKYTSLNLDLGTTYLRKWITKIHVVGQNFGNVATQINVIRDMNADQKGVSAAAGPINYTDNDYWGNPNWVWGDASKVWNNTGKMDVWRRFPQTSLRSDFVQIQLVPASLAVYASSSYPVGCNTAVASNTTATIITPAGYTAIVWPLDVVDMSIYFQTDGYVKGYVITAVSTNVITFTDASLTSPTTASTGWVIRGIKKEQRFSLTSYVVHFMHMGDKTQAYPGKYTTSGPGNAGENPS